MRASEVLAASLILSIEVSEPEQVRCLTWFLAVDNAFRISNPGQSLAHDLKSALQGGVQAMAELCVVAVGGCLQFCPH